MMQPPCSFQGNEYEHIFFGAFLPEVRKSHVLQGTLLNNLCSEPSLFYGYFWKLFSLYEGGVQHITPQTDESIR